MKPAGEKRGPGQQEGLHMEGIFLFPPNVPILGHFGPRLVGFWWETRYVMMLRILCDNVETH